MDDESEDDEYASEYDDDDNEDRGTSTKRVKRDERMVLIERYFIIPTF